MIMADRNDGLILVEDTKRCLKCGKTLKINKFYRTKNGDILDLCKSCFTMHMDAYNPETFLWALEKCDVPYIPVQWNNLRDKQYEKDPDKFDSGVVFGKYLSTMKLGQWRKYRWADTESLAGELEAKAEKAEQKRQEYIEAREAMLRKDRDEGKIPEAEYLTYMQTESIKKEREEKGPDLPSIEEVIGKNNMFKEEDYLDSSQLPDLAAGLTQKDRVYLAMKWGNAYKVSEQIELERKYKGMKEDLDIVDSDTEGSLILCCKTYLKMNQAIDCGDIDSYQKLSKVYDSIRKSGNFTAAQRKKEAKVNFIDSVGNLVKYCEKMGGAIPRHDLSIDYDILDTVIKDLKGYNRALIYEDPSIARQIENYIKRRKQLDEENAVAEKAAKQGINLDEISAQSVESKLEYMEMIEQSRAEDMQIQGDEVDDRRKT